MHVHEVEEITILLLRSNFRRKKEGRLLVQKNSGLAIPLEHSTMLFVGLYALEFELQHVCFAMHGPNLGKF